MCSTKIFFATIFNEIKFHVNTSLGLVGGMHPPLCPRLCVWSAFLKQIFVLLSKNQPPNQALKVLQTMHVL